MAYGHLWLLAAAPPGGLRDPPRDPPRSSQGSRVGWGEPAPQPPTHISAEPGPRSPMGLTWCEYTLVSFCHLLLSLKHYISICFHTSLPSQPPLLEAHSTDPSSWAGTFPHLLEPGSFSRPRRGWGEPAFPGVRPAKVGLVPGRQAAAAPSHTSRPTLGGGWGSHSRRAFAVGFNRMHDFGIKSK